MTAYEGSHELQSASFSTEAASIADIAVQGVEPKEVAPGEVFTGPDGRGGIKVLDTDQYAASPRRTTGTRTVLNAQSFAEYINRHGIDGTEVFAHSPSSSVVGVIDSNEGAGREPGWQGHRVTLALEHTKAWKAWEKFDGEWFTQVDFADFIEQRAVDVREPDHAVLIEMAQKFEAKRSVDFTSAERRDSGEVTLEYAETIKTKSGQKGEITIPKELLLTLQPYVGGTRYAVYANFRYRLEGTGVKLGFVLQRTQEILDAAFADIVTEIRDGRTEPGEDGKPDVVVFPGIKAPIFLGKP